jgi:hypothetical protein
VEQPEIEILVGELETAVDRLRSLYEQYFMGFEKMEPAVPRKDVDRKIHVLRKEHFRNTAMRFRFQMILQRYNTYQTHWQRVLREIDAGTYKRHVLRAERRFGDSAARRTPPPPALALPQPGAELSRELAAQLAELDIDFDAPAATPPAAVAVAVAVATPAARPPRTPQAPRPTPSVVSPLPPRPAPPLRPAAAPLAAPPPLPRPVPAAAAPAAAPPAPRPTAVPAPAQPPPLPPRPAPRPIPTADDGLSDERVRQIYAQYVDAKRRQNESTAAITYENVAKSLRESTTRLQQKHGKKVDFEVAVKDGKTILKPVLR